jgi:hypothetical protein
MAPSNPIPIEIRVHLARLRDLIRAAGVNAFLRAPLVTPEDRWFPDPWTADLESVRRQLFRLAGYAGLDKLGIEVVAFSNTRSESRVPAALLPAAVASPGPAAHYRRIHDGSAWIGVPRSFLGTPECLVEA